MKFLLRIWLVTLALGACGELAHAQRDNTFYVKEFDGTTVAQKVTNAQNQCNSNVLIPCVIVFDPILAVYTEGTLPSKCTQCVWRDWRTYGNGGGLLNYTPSPYKWLELLSSKAGAFADAPALKFNGTIYCFDNAVSPTENCPVRIGYNVTSGGGREDASYGAVYISWEPYYETSAGVFAQEAHLEYINNAGGSHRAWTSISRTDGYTDIGFANDILYIANEAGAVKAYMGLNGLFDWYLGNGSADDALVDVMRFPRNTAIGSDASIKFQKAASLDFLQMGGFRVAYTNGQIALGTVNPQAGTFLYVPASASIDGIDVTGAPTTFYWRCRNGATNYCRQSTTAAEWASAQDLRVYSDNSFSTKVWEMDGGTGQVTTYGGNTQVGRGIPAQVATVDLTAQGAAIASTALYNTGAGGDGFYRACYVATVTRAATTSSTLGGTAGFQLIYQDANDSVTKTSAAAGAPSAGVNQAYAQTNQGNTTATQISGCVVAWAAAANNINYSFGYTSSGATTMQYNLHIRLEKM